MVIKDEILSVFFQLPIVCFIPLIYENFMNLDSINDESFFFSFITFISKLSG